MITRVEISVLDTHAFRAFVQRVDDFIQEYAWHTRDCAAVDSDGEWHQGNASCDCGYEDAMPRWHDPEVSA